MPEIIEDPEHEHTFAYSGGVLVNVHDPSLCAGRPCVIHNPSDHNMRGWPLVWRGAGFLSMKPPHFERTCPHGIGHPDPDEIAYHGSGVSFHGCDGCC